MARKSQITVDQVNSIIHSYNEEKKSLSQLGKSFGVSAASIRYILLKHNVKLRNRSEGIKLYHANKVTGDSNAV